MRTSAICPTCATYENALCVIYNGPTLSSINVPTLTNLQAALVNINSTISNINTSISNIPTTVIQGLVAGNNISIDNSNPFFPVISSSGAPGPAPTPGWELLGNSGTNGLLNFIGTTDAQDFVLKANNITSLTLSSSDNSVTTPTRFKVASGAVMYAQLDVNSNKGRLTLSNSSTSAKADLQCTNISSNRVLELPNSDGTLVTKVNNTSPDTAGNINLAVWSLIGNAGTTPGTNFIGTTDAQDLVFKTNNLEYLRIPASSSDTSDIISYKRIQISAPKAQFWANSSGNGYATIGANSTDKGYFGISNGTGAATIKAANLTGNKTLELPNANGTLVTSVNNSTPDAAGNVTLSVSGWGLTGNTGTSPLTNFIGTTDNQDVVLKANNLTALTLRASGATVDVAARLRVYDENTSIAYVQLDQATGNGRMILRNSSSGAAIISSSGLTGTTTYTLPNKNGILAIEEYKVYSAIVTFTAGQLQVVEQLQNTTGRTFTFATSGTISEITASSSLFTANKTVFIGNSFVGSAVYNVIGSYFSATKLNVVAYDTNTQLPAIDNGYPFFIEIRIYP